MPRFAANISTMFGEYPFLERIDQAAAWGFEGVECQFPYDTPAAEIADRLHGAGVSLVLLNAPPGDLAAGDRGLATEAERGDEFQRSIERAQAYALATACPRIHVMAGCRQGPAAEDCFVERIGWAADQLVGDGIDVLVEPMNHRDVPGYLLDGTAIALHLMDRIGRPNVKLQFDTYHLQIQQGDLLATLEGILSHVGHIQFSSLPGRHEPDQGEVDHRWFFARLDELGWADWVGAEYRPRTTTADGLGWAQPYGIGPGSG